MKLLYAIPTHQCNLRCPHCTIYGHDEKYDHDKFMSALNAFDGDVILFGGEPTLYRDRLFNIVNDNPSGSIGGISTNLLTLDPELISLFQTKIGHVATSWNKTRFNLLQYKLWLANVHELANAGLKPLVLITLTHDLINEPASSFIKTMSGWNPDDIAEIQFEHYISPKNTAEYYRNVDSWLCDFCINRDPRFNIEIINNAPKWHHNCDEVYTLEPDGTLINKCPNALYTSIAVPNKCITCDKSNECRPCMLHHHCSRPNWLFELIEEIGGNKNA